MAMIVLEPDRGLGDSRDGGAGGAQGPPAPIGLHEPLEMAPEASFDRIVDFARILFDVTMVMLRVIDDRRQTITSSAGIEATDLPAVNAVFDRTMLRCAVPDRAVPDRAVPDRAVPDRAVPDRPGEVPGAPSMNGAGQDPAGDGIGDGPIRFYAAAPLITPDRQCVGAVCIFSREARPPLSDVEQRRLEALAGIATHGLDLRSRLSRATLLANERFVMAHEIEHRVHSSLDLVADVLNAQASRSADRRVRNALYEAADRISGVETVHQQLRQGDAIFETDAREYLLALIGGLQDSAADEDAGRTISIVLPAELRVAPDRLARLGMAVTELVTRALRHGHGGVEVSAWREGTTVVLSATDEGAAASPAASPWAARRPQDALGLRLLSMLAQPGGVLIDPSGPQRITVRLAA